MDLLAEEMPRWNPYHYVFNNPIQLVDPLGLMPEPPDDYEGNVFEDESGSYTRNSNTEPWVVSIPGAEDGAYVGTVEVVGSKAQSSGGSGFNTDMVDEIAGAIGVNMDAKEGIIQFAEKSGDIGKAGNNYLKVTKILGKATGWTSADTSWVDYQNNQSTANTIKLVSNIVLAAARINPFVNLGIGIIDLSGGTDWMYNQAGDYWDKNWGGQ